MREFILLALKARTSPDFNVNNLTEGKMDLVCRTISNTLFVSHHIRDDTVLYIAMSGPKSPPKMISFYGARLKGIRPDESEKEIAKYIKNALREGLSLKLNEEKEVQQGFKVAKKAFERLVKEKAETSQLVYLHPRGEDIRTFDFKENVTVILGDFIGLPTKTEKLLKRLGAKKIKLGPTMLYASNCPIIVHNELDRRRAEW